VNEVLPYLIRRAEENSNMLGGAGKEIQLIKGELKRRRMGGK
jgi:proline dehydrogenase